MKRIAIGILALVMMVGLMVPATAGAINTSGGTSTTNVTYTVTSTFTVTIPDAVEFSDNTLSVDGTITVGPDSIIGANDKMFLIITGSTNYDSGNNKFRLGYGTPVVYHDYTIEKAGGTPVILSTAFQEWTAAEIGAATKPECTLTFETEALTVAGSFTDTLTFTVYVGTVYPPPVP